MSNLTYQDVCKYPNAEVMCDNEIYQIDHFTRDSITFIKKPEHTIPVWAFYSDCHLLLTPLVEIGDLTDTILIDISELHKLTAILNKIQSAYEKKQGKKGE